jgi:hypothetical protein
MSLGATELRGTIAVTPIAALRRTLYLISAGFGHAPALLPTRSFPPIRDRVGLQYVNHYIANVSKLLLVDPFRFSRVWFALVHSVLSFVAVLHTLVGCTEHSNERKQGVAKFTQELVNLTQAKKGAANVKHS